jgi:hypothetical protein
VDFPCPAGRQSSGLGVLHPERECGYLDGDATGITRIGRRFSDKVDAVRERAVPRRDDQEGVKGHGLCSFVLCCVKPFSWTTTTCEAITG